MVITKTFRGIAFAVLVLSTVLVGIAVLTAVAFAGPASTIVVNASNTTPQVNQTISISATVKDANGSISTSLDNGTMLFLANNTQFDSATITNGVAGTTFTRATAGTVTITASFNATLQGSVTVTFSDVPQPTLVLSRTPAVVTVAIPTNVTFTATSANAPVNGATITLTGVATGNGTTDASGSAVISVNATGAGTITATASKTGFDSGSTVLTAVVAADTTPPASVTNLTLTGNGTTWLLITWTNPGDTDFHHVKLFKNGSFVGNTTSNTVNSYNITGLISGTTYTITVKTVDATGNVNETGTTLIAGTDPNTPASAGQVTVTLQNSIVTFASVITAGNTVENMDNSHTLPSGYTAVGNSINILTSATYSPPIEVSVKYNPSLLLGYTESDVRLYHWNDSTTQWDDVTISVDPSTDKVTGKVSSLSPFVAAVSPKPIIIKVSPTEPNVETTGSASQAFRIKVSQTANVTWYINSNPVTSSSLVLADVETNYTPTPRSSGKYVVSVNATNTNGSSTANWNWTVHPKTYETGNRIWDASKPDQFSLTYTWNPMSFSGFYYDIKDDVGNESITITLDSYTDRTVEKGKLVYTTTPDIVNFGYSGFGSYQVIGFMAEKYFAGYTANTTPPSPTVSIGAKSVLAQGQLHRVLIDDDTKRTISVGSTLTLQEGYVLKAKDIDLSARTMLLSVLKDGNEVDVTPLSAGQTYVYTKRVGSVSDLPIILVRFDSVFSGKEVQAAFLKGLFQISENPTTVKSGNQFKDMKVRSVGSDRIVMSNDADISLGKGNTEELMGDVKIIAADNDTVRFALSAEKTGTFEVRSTVYRGTDANPVDQWNPYNFGMNIGKTSIGFYYDLDDGIGNESLRLAASSNGSRTITDRNLVYTTTPETVTFGYSGFGSYQVIGFMAEKYFAGYTANTTPPNPTVSVGVKSALAQGQLHKVLIDDDTKRTISVGSTLTLKDGYVLKAKDIDLSARTMLLSVLKDGNEVDVTPLSAGQTYVYTKRVGAVSDLPIILVRFDSVFSGKEVQAAFLKGLFQISESPTTVKSGNQFKDMKVRSVGSDGIVMSNDADISLDKNRIENLMGNIKLKVADSDTLRFYFAVDVTPEMVANQLVIDAPAKATAGDAINIKVTAGGNTVEGASVAMDSEIGQTDKNGLVNYTLPRTLKGIYNITTTKLGYEKAVRSIEILQYVDLRLSIDAPAKANQFGTITIKVTYNSTPMSGAAVSYDNATIGTTDSNGVLNYTLQTSGTHTISASKSGYITAARDIEVRPPFSEYRALNINITPSSAFTNANVLIRSNITNVGTKADTLPVELISNGTVVDNRSVSLAPGEIKEINFTRKEALPGNYTVEILGQKGLLEVKEAPLNLLLIGGIATGLGAIVIYLLTAKSKMSLELLRQKLLGKFVKKGAEKVTLPEEGENK